MAKVDLATISAENSEIEDESNSKSRYDALEISECSNMTLIESKKQIVIRCGKSSITLMEDGKIIVKGSKIVSRASGENAIKGSQIKLN